MPRDRGLRRQGTVFGYGSGHGSGIAWTGSTFAISWSEQLEDSMDVFLRVL